MGVVLCLSCIYNSYQYVPYIIIVDCSSESLVSFSVCLVSPEQLRTCSLHNYSRLFVRIIGVVFCLSCILQQLRIGFLHAEDCSRQSLVSLSPCTYNSYEYVPYKQKIVRDSHCCRFLFVPNSNYQYVPYIQNIVRDNHSCFFLLLFFFFSSSLFLVPTTVTIRFPTCRRLFEQITGVIS